MRLREIFGTNLRRLRHASGLSQEELAHRAGINRNYVGLLERALLWGPYRSFAQMLAEDPRASEVNPMFRRTTHPGVGEFLTASTPLDFSGTARLPPGVAPRLGEHTRAVLREHLALDDAALEALARTGALGAG